jgi:hypothetical protein
MDFNKLAQQAQQMQEQMQKAQEEMANEVVEGTAGGGAVVVKATGTGKIIEIKIKKERSTRRIPRRSRISCSPRSTPRCRPLRTWRRRS